MPAININRNEKSPLPNKKEAMLMNNLKIVKSMPNLNSLMKILGIYSNDLLYILENQGESEKQAINCINQLKSLEFMEIQKQREAKVQGLFDKFFMDILIQHCEDKDINREIAQIISKEITHILSFYEKYIVNQEDSLKRLNKFQDKQVILITDFHDALRILMDTYNFYFRELEVYGEKKQSYNVYVKSLFQFKSMLKTDTRNEKVSLLFEELESLLKSNFEKIDTCMIKLSKLSQENEQLTKMCMELQSERSKFSHTLISLQNKSTTDSGDNNNTSNNSNQTNNPANKSIQLLEDYYSQILENLKAENKRLNEQVQKQNKKMQLFSVSKEGTLDSGTQPLVQQQQQSSKASEELKNKVKQYYSADKQVQCTFIVEKNPVQKKENDISQILLQPLLYLKSATVQSKEWLLMTTNTIYADKLISDIFDEQDLRPSSPLHLYVSEWFLTKFGNKDIAESLLKDYLISLKKYGKSNERFKIFCEMCGLDELLESESDGQASYSYNPSTYSTPIGKIYYFPIKVRQYYACQGVNRAKFKKAYMRTQEGQTILHKVACLVRMTAKNYFGSNNCLPLLPNILQKCLDLVPQDYSLRVWETIVTEENLNKLDLSSLETKYKRIVQQDVASRVNDPLGVYSGSEGQEEGYIRFDTLARCILETIVDQRFFELESIYAALKLKSNPRHECFIGYSDFSKILNKTMPKKSARWAEIAYREFCQGTISEKTPLNVAIMRLIPFLVNDDCMRPNFLQIRPPRAFELFVPLILPPPTPVEDTPVNKTASRGSSASKSKSSRASFTQSTTTPKQPSKTGNSIMNSSISNSPLKKPPPVVPTVDQAAELQKFKEKTNQIYDPVSQLGLLEESYKMMYPLIKQLEKKNQNLQTLHTSIKEDFAALPSSIVKQVKYDAFEERQKEELMNYIEATWEKFRKMLSSITKS